MKLLVYLLLTAKVCATPFPESTAIVTAAQAGRSLSKSVSTLSQSQGHGEEYDEDADNRQQDYAKAVETIGAVMDAA
jgi:hypothetical protein